MKQVVVSNCEKAFLLKAISEGTRLDGRSLEESRPLKICFGASLGSCCVSLGNTKVSSHVSCKIEEPKQTKPNEGRLYVNVELGTMGAPNFENRQSDLNVYLNRLVEKCLIDSRCVDLESLCVVTEEKVWVLRVDIHVLNHAGNIIECASVAALASLAHFKRPDITTDGEEIIVHTLSEKDPIPTVIHHYPVIVTFGFFNDELMVSDPNLLEEIVCGQVGAIFAVGMNSYREVCLFDLASAAITLGPAHIYKASQQAARRAQLLVTEIKRALSEDEKLRSERKPIGFSNAISTDKLMTTTCENICVRLNKFDINMKVEEILKASKSEKDDSKGTEMEIVKVDEAAALILVDKNMPKKDKGGTWAQMGSADEISDDDHNAKDDEQSNLDDDIQVIENKRQEAINISSGSEEDEVVIIDTKKTAAPSKKRKGKNKTRQKNSK